MKQKVYSSFENAQKNLQGKSIFLVSGRGSFEKSGAKKRLNSILSNDYVHFNEFSTNPKIEDAKRGINRYLESGADMIMAVGGGSVMDMAKLIKGLPLENCETAMTLNQVNGSNIPLMAVPTTSGSGSESTPFAVGYVNGKKYSLHHHSLLPNEIILDHSLTSSLPPRQTASTGFDALSQAIEAYWSINSTEESLKLSRQSISLVFGNLERAVNSPGEQNRASMLEAANLAGKAIAIAKTTACHAISYPLTSKFGVLHGHAVALTLGEILEYNSNVAEKDCVDPRGTEYVRNTLIDISKRIGANTPYGAKIKLYELMKSVGLETKLSELDINNTDFIFNEVNKQRMKNNPRNIDQDILSKILERIK